MPPSHRQRGSLTCSIFQVTAFTAQCKGDVAKAKRLVDAPCERHLDSGALRTKLKHLQRLMAAQDRVLKEGEAAVRQARQKAVDIASQSARLRTQLQKGLATQKKRQQELAGAKQNAAAADNGLSAMRQKADDAMKNAVKVAGATGDESKVATAKEAAHSLYRTMVDQKIKIASVHRQVVVAKDALALVAAKVEKQLLAAKKTADKEANALRMVSSVQKQLARARYLRTKYNAEQFAAKYKTAKMAEEVSRQKLAKLAPDVATSTTAVSNSKLDQRQAQRARNAVSHIRVGSSALDMQKIQKDARKAATNAPSGPK